MTSLETRVAALEREIARLKDERLAPWLGPAAAAAYLGCTLETFRYYYHALKAFPGYKRGRGRGRLIFRREDLDTWILRRAQGGPFRAIAGRRS